MGQATSNPWDVKLSEDKRKDFTDWICDEIINAEQARSTPVEDVRYWWMLYEQARTRAGHEPWQDAADLTSYIATEKVDALRARIMKTIWSDPVWTVEGWGGSAHKAPFVEAFHQWQAEAEGVQAVLARVMHAALVEPRAVLEVYEDTTLRAKRKTINAKLALTPDGRHQLDDHLQPMLEQDEDGNYVEVDDDEGGQIATAETVIDEVERVRCGPAYRVLSYEHFLVLPAHAREKSDIFGYAKRFTKRMGELKVGAKQGWYDKTAVEELTDGSDVQSETTLSGDNVLVAEQRGDTIEKELWEVQVLYNLDGKGPRWYLATVHVKQRKLLRLKHDGIQFGRYIIFVPFPRPDRCHEGYSFVGHKLITTVEEHTAWRNMLADRAAMVLKSPIKRLNSALWDPDVQAFGPGAVIDVRDMKELEPFVMPDLSAAAINREQEVVNASERVAGINDVALGQVPQNSRTLGEVNLVAEQSFVRMDEVTKNLQEPLEDLAQVRHEIWKAALKELKEMSGPDYLFEALDGERGGDVTQDAGAMAKITPDLMEGTFRFKPHGSTETADITRQRADFIQFLQSLGIAFKTWPALQMIIGNNIGAAQSTIEQMLRLFRMPDKQAWLGNGDQQGAGGLPPMLPGMPPMPGMMPGMGGPPGMPGMPPGMLGQPPMGAPTPPQAPMGGGS